MVFQFQSHSERCKISCNINLRLPRPLRGLDKIPLQILSSCAGERIDGTGDGDFGLAVGIAEDGSFVAIPAVVIHEMSGGGTNRQPASGSLVSQPGGDTLRQSRRAGIFRGGKRIW